MVTAAGHDLNLRAPPFLGGSLSPTILERTDQGFMKNVLQALSTDEGRASLNASVAKAVEGKLRLYRPMHRTFHLAMIDARCVAIGAPRIDGRRIESAGLVIRRILGNEVQGWMQGDDGFRGWVPLGPSQRTADPDPARRRRPTSGNAVIDQHLALRTGASRARTEAHTRLYVAPPQACKASGATVLYGLLPLGTAESTSSAPDATFTEEEALDALPGILRAGKPQIVPSAGGTLFKSDADRQDDAFRRYMEGLEQLLVQFDLRGEGDGSKRLRALLAAIPLEYASGKAGDALAHVERAIDVLLHRDDSSAAGVEMPARWPELTLSQQGAFASLVREILTARFASFAPRVGRFDREGVEYEAVAFVRVKHDDGCPPVIHWSSPSERFTLASWFEGGPVAPPLIQLPEISNFKKLKPNVAFAVPPSLFNFLRKNDPKELMKGNAKKGDGGAIAWICGFNISIVFMIAFIIMFMFAIMFNIVFFWMAYIKICIPVPASFKKNS